MTFLYILKIEKYQDNHNFLRMKERFNKNVECEIKYFYSMENMILYLEEEIINQLKYNVEYYYDNELLNSICRDFVVCECDNILGLKDIYINESWEEKYYLKGIYVDYVLKWSIDYICEKNLLKNKKPRKLIPRSVLNNYRDKFFSNRCEECNEYMKDRAGKLKCSNSCV